MVQLPQRIELEMLLLCDGHWLRLVPGQDSKTVGGSSKFQKGGAIYLTCLDLSGGCHRVGSLGQ